MKAFFKPIFVFFTDNLSLFDNVLYDFLLMGIIGLVAFRVAFSSVGWFYALDIIDSREAGSFLHWVIRSIAFLVLFTFVYFFIWLVKIIIANPVILFLILGIVLILVITMVCIFKIWIKRGMD